MIVPLQPLNPAQRLGWLPHFSSLKCAVSYPPAFTAGVRYAMTCETTRVQSKERRARRDGLSEPVTYTGASLVVRIKDDRGDWHRFLERPQAEHALIHDFVFLVKHFAIPEIPDQASLQPNQFAEYKRRLKELEN